LALGIDPKKLPKTVPAEQLLSEYAQKWAYKISEGPGANCWHTSISSINHNWIKPRRMLPPEFLCHLNTSFQHIDAPAQWGDLVRLSMGGSEVHGFTFLGLDRADSSRQIVFTKNGYAQGYFLFSDVQTVRNIYFGCDATYFRRTKVAIDPIQDPSAPCARAAEMEFESLEEPVDAIIRAGMNLKPLSELEPLTWMADLKSNNNL